MKITLDRMREIITEEVIKEELASEIASPAIAAMLQGTDSVDTSEIFGAVFDEMYGEGALESEAERMASAEEEEAPKKRRRIGYALPGEEVEIEGDLTPERGKIRGIHEIIQEELEALLNEIKND